MGTKKIRGMRSVSGEKRLKELGSDSLAKQRQREDLIAYHKYSRRINTKEERTVQATKQCCHKNKRI